MKEKTKQIKEISNWNYEKIGSFLFKKYSLSNNDFYILGSTYGQNKVYSEMLKKSVISIGFESHLDLSEFYGKKITEIKRKLEDSGVEKKSVQPLSKFLTIKVGDKIAIKDNGSPKDGKAFLSIIGIAEVVEKNGKVYEHDPNNLGHTLNVKFTKSNIYKEFKYGGFGSTIHQLDKLKFTKNIIDIFNENYEEQYIEKEKTVVERSHNRIIYGAPGTGKSYQLNLDIGGLNIERVTFYDGYTHGQFVGTYKPVPSNGNITYKYVAGPFMKQLVEAYKNPNDNFCLVIEEINRARADKVFGNIFQLLDRDSNGESEYPIAISEDQRIYLKEELSDEYSDIFEKLEREGLHLPSNLYIWATMNSADQGVYPLDSAFKRRWSFEHIGLNENEGSMKDMFVSLEEKGKVSWNAFRRVINKTLLKDKVSEDRLIAPFFVKKEAFEDGALNNQVFIDKVLVYLFDDVLRHKKKTIIFANDINSFSELKEKFKENKLGIFSEPIQNQFKENLITLEPLNEVKYSTPSLDEQEKLDEVAEKAEEFAKGKE